MPPRRLGGLDRINNDCGYHIWNVVPCCTLCNTVKGEDSVSFASIKGVEVLRVISKEEGEIMAYYISKTTYREVGEAILHIARAVVESDSDREVPNFKDDVSKNETLVRSVLNYAANSLEEPPSNRDLNDQVSVTRRNGAVFITPKKRRVRKSAARWAAPPEVLPLPRHKSILGLSAGLEALNDGETVEISLSITAEEEYMLRRAASASGLDVSFTPDRAGSTTMRIDRP